MSSDSNAFELLALEMLKEKKRKRRFMFLKLFIVVFIIALLVFNSDKPVGPKKDHAALIEITGPIFEAAMASSDNLHKSLLSAYHAKGVKALILRINSPGGSPVEADLIYQDIKRFREKYKDIPVYAVCTDACASAAYYIAAASDEIYANPSSMVGSIGVLYNGFGFVDAMEKLGVQRRLMTAGKDKGFLDPFSKENPEQVKSLQTMLDIVHKQFEESVIKGRKGRLKKSDDLFSGRVWTGVQAKPLGIIDEFGSVWTVLNDKAKQKHLVDYTHKEGFAEKLMREFSAEISQNFFEQLKSLRFS